MSEEKAMTAAAKTYLTTVFAASVAILGSAVYLWSSRDSVYFPSFFALALLGATRKIRIPGLSATMSLTFLFVLVSVVEFSFSESILMATVTALVQLLWKPAERPRPLQIAFAAATMACATCITYLGTRWILAIAPGQPSLAVHMLLATVLLLLSNTGLVAMVVALVEGGDLLGTWRHSYVVAFPYFAIGGALAGIVCLSQTAMGWQFSVLLLPFSYLLYLFYQIHLHHPAPSSRAGGLR